MNDYAAIGPVMPMHRVEPRLTRDKQQTNTPWVTKKKDDDDDDWQSVYMQALEPWLGNSLDVSAKPSTKARLKRHP